MVFSQLPHLCCAREPPELKCDDCRAYRNCHTSTYAITVSSRILASLPRWAQLRRRESGLGRESKALLWRNCVFEPEFHPVTCCAPIKEDKNNRYWLVCLQEWHTYSLRSCFEEWVIIAHDIALVMTALCFLLAIPAIILIFEGIESRASGILIYWKHWFCWSQEATYFYLNEKKSHNTCSELLLQCSGTICIKFLKTIPARSGDSYDKIWIIYSVIAKHDSA